MLPGFFALRDDGILVFRSANQHGMRSLTRNEVVSIFWSFLLILMFFGSLKSHKKSRKHPKPCKNHKKPKPYEPKNHAANCMKNTPDLPKMNNTQKTQLRKLPKNTQVFSNPRSQLHSASKVSFHAGWRTWIIREMRVLWFCVCQRFRGPFFRTMGSTRNETNAEWSC